MPFPKVVKNDIGERLKKIGVQRGDVIYVASFISILGDSPTILDDTITALIEAVGAEGTVVMPAFNWDYCSGAVFDPLETPSQVGVLTEAFRKYRGVLRSITPPWCTFAAIGQRAKEIVKIKGTSPFGPDSITQYLYDINARYILIGCNYNEAVIHLHWLEERFEVPYRFWKRFIGQVKIKDKFFNNVSYMYARRLDIDTEINSRHITDKFDKTDKVKMERLGLGEVRGFMAKDYVEFVSPYFERDRLTVLPPEGRRAFQ